MKCHHIVSPGCLPIRLVRAILKGKALYANFDIPTLGDGENQFVSVSVGKNCDSQKIKSIFKELDKFEGLLSVYLHGSWADSTTTPFSDIDDFIVLEDRQLSQGDLREIIAALNKVDMRFCRIDPLQHHGHWLTCRSELADYDNSFIPLFILRESRLLLGSRDVRANINHATTIDGLRSNIRNFCGNIVSLVRKLHSGSISAYELKILVGSFALMPAFIFQLNGLELNKPEAISRAGEIYSVKSMELIKWSTECRANWSVVTNMTKYRLFSLLTYLVSNPFIWRKIAAKYSPQVSQAKLSRLSGIRISNSQVECFIAESLMHVDQRDPVAEGA